MRGPIPIREEATLSGDCEYLRSETKIHDPRQAQVARRPIFYGWRIVWASFAIAVVLWSLTIFGASFYLHTISQNRGWSIALISGGVTLFYLTSAGFSFVAAKAIDHFGPSLVAACGSVPLALGVIGLGRVTEPWQVYFNFVLLGISYAALGATAIATTLAPWFERRHGQAVSLALMGASVGGIIGVPMLVFGTDTLGFAQTTLAAGIASTAVILPVALTVLKHRPEDLSLSPDGEIPAHGAQNWTDKEWNLAEGLRTPMLSSVIFAFGIALSMQLGFLTHQLSLVAPSLGEAAASITVSATGAAALVGRVLFSYIADRVNLRMITASLFGIGSIAFAAMALFPLNFIFVGACIAFGLTLGNVTALSPIIVRREFGAPSFGTIYGFAAVGIGLVSALGPTIWGVLHDTFNGYRASLLISACLDLLAAVVIIVGGRKLEVG